MDNQQNQPGSPMPGADIRVENATTSSSTTGQATAGTPGSTTGVQRKTASGRYGAQGAASQSESDQSREDQPSEGTFLNTALESGKKWIEDTRVLDSVNQLPQNVKDWSNRAASRVGNLSTTQKVVGGAILAAGLGWLALRKGKSDSSSSSVYGRQGNASYARKSGYGYQSPEAGNRRPATASARSASTPSFENSTNLGSERKSSGYGGASSSDYGSRTSESGYDSSSQATDASYRSGDDYRSIE